MEIEDTSSESGRSEEACESKGAVTGQGPSIYVRGHEWFEKHGQWSKWLVDQNRATLVQNGDFSNISDHLIKAGVFTDNEMEKIEKTKGRGKRMSKFLDTLRRKPEWVIQKCFDVVCEADPILHDQVQWLIPSIPSPEHHSTGVGQISEELNAMQTEVREWYKSQLSRFRPIPWSPMLEMDFDHVFTNLKMVEGRKESWRITDQGTKAVDVDSIEGLSEVMFSPEGRTITFVQGPAGTGKSTLCRRLAYIWAKNSHHIYRRHFDLVLLLEARSMVGDNINECIVQQVLPKDFDLSEHDICKCVNRCGGNCLMIIDGVDELTQKGKAAIIDLLQGKFLRHINVIITGRPEALIEFIRYADVHLEISGFTKDNVEAYVCKHFTKSKSEYRDRMLKILKDNSELQEAAVNPFTTLLMCLLVQDNSSEIPSNFNDILHQVIMLACKHYVSKIDMKYNVNDADLFRIACKVAHLGFEEDKLEFQENEIKEICTSDLSEHFLKSGLLTKDFSVSRLHTVSYWYFPQRSIHEHLAACHLVDARLETSNDIVTSCNLNHIWTWNRTFLAILYLLRKQRPRFHTYLSRILDIACPQYRQVKRGFQEFVGRATCEKRCRMGDEEAFNSRAFLFRQILDALCYIHQDGREVFVNIIRGNSDMLKVFLCDNIFSCFNSLCATCAKAIPIPLTNQFFLRKRVSLDGYTVYYKDPNVVRCKWSKVYATCVNHSKGKLRVPWLHCDSLKDACSTLKYDKVWVMATLSVLLLPDTENAEYVHRFIDFLTSVKKRLTLLLIVPNLLCEDLSRVKLLNLINGCDYPKVKVCYDHPNIPVHVSQDDESNEGGHCLSPKLTYDIPNPVHHMYYNKHCPF
ncbi:NLR family CARD domain-containing protein 4-like [Liolophura sinensis]|uniref:NLR family CARD domain-containing protein 4-like n=1 Tax=Liolophura sinensis TaxID=3198878 RepID=UPI0031594F6D